MKLHLYSLIHILCSALSLGANAQTDVEHFVPGTTVEGVAYFLPRTAFRVTIIAEKTTTRPGDFCKYADRYLRLKSVPMEESVEWSLKDIKLEPYGKPDKQKAYSIKLKGRTVAPLVGLSRDGILLSINTDANESFLPDLPKPEKGAAPENPRNYMTQEILAAGSTAKMAELTSREIYDLRENRSLLIKGQADFMPQDGAQLKLMLAQIDEEEKALMTMFQGTTVCDTSEYVITIVPEGPVQRQHLFRLSQQLGLVDADDLSGAPYYIRIEDLDAVPATDLEAAAKTKKKVYESGVYVNVPGRMRSTIYAGIDQIDQKEMPAAQFGNVELLSADLFDKHYTTHLWLSPVTGAVERLDADMKK